MTGAVFHRKLGPATRRDPRQLPRDARTPSIYRLSRQTVERSLDDPLARTGEMARLEAALMLADEPMNARRLATVASIPDLASVRRLIEQLREWYDRDGTAFQIHEIAGGYQLLSREAFQPWLLRWRRETTEVQLSAAALDTLTIVAYRQPITRADLEKVRGVHSGELLNQLLEKGLIRITGRDTSLGRPVLYGTTRKFLQEFGLNSLKDLPPTESS